MAEDSVAQLLLESAGRDASTVDALAGLAHIHDSIVGFHAQQAVEKYLKAVLSAQGVVFRRTHDLAELLDILADNDLPRPPHADVLDELNPYAVEARYGLTEPSCPGRNTLPGLVADVRLWAEGQIKRH